MRGRPVKHFPFLDDKKSQTKKMGGWRRHDRTGGGGYMKGLSFLSATVYIYDESYEDGSAPAVHISFFFPHESQDGSYIF